MGECLPRRSAPPPTFPAFAAHLRLRPAQLRPLVRTATPATRPNHRVHPRRLCPSSSRAGSSAPVADRESSPGHTALLLSEVVFLELDDLDWNLGQLSVRGKSGPRSDLPLPPDVGQAIASYLRRGRPQSSHRRVFLRTRAPRCGFRGPAAIASLVRHRLQRAGVDAPTYGAHQFRHGLATEMLRQGASLGEIGELLGHRSPGTTKIYAKVDLDALRTLALPWPGGGR